MKKKININNINLWENIARSNGITLIALIITIIILLILASVTINLTLGENGLFNTAKRAGEEYEKAGIKEEIEYAIVDIKIEKLQNGEELTMDILEQELPNKLKDITAEKDDEGQIVGEYKGYDYTITKDYEVIVESAGVKPVVTYTLSDETIGINELTITLQATISEGTITKIIKPDENYEENVDEVQYKVTQNGKYKFIVESSNDTKTTKIVQITNLRPIAPVIKSDEAYPVLTQYGVEGAKVEIVYEENENLEHYYSEDNGTTWKIYTGEFKPTSSTIIAKSVVKANPDCYTQTQVDNAIPNDALGAGAYDGDETTNDEPGAGKMKKIRVSSEMQNKNMLVTIDIGSYDNKYPSYIRFYDKENTLISEIRECRRTFTKELVLIPSGTEEIQFHRNGNGNIKIYEISEGSIPILNTTIIYPTVTENGIEQSHTNVTIEYFETSVQKLYKIDEENWQNYQNNSIRLEIGQTIYAKGVNEKGSDSNVISYTATMPSDALEAGAYDGDDVTYDEPGAGKMKKIRVSSETQNKNMIVTINIGSYDKKYPSYIRFYNKENELINEIGSGWRTFTKELVLIPNGTEEIQFHRNGNGNIKIYEITLE